MIRIDEEFKSLIPPLTDEEFKQLEDNCVRDGIRDPLVVWHVPDSDDILIDGHNRWEICAKHSGIQFNIRRMDFNDRDEAKLWIMSNQLGRRNLSEVDRITLEDKMQGVLAKQAKARIKSGAENPTKKSLQGQGLTESQIRRQNSTDYKIARAAGVSEDTVRKVRAINKSPDADRLKEQIRSGEISINQAHNIVQVAKAEAEGRIPTTKSQKKRQEVQEATERNEAYEQAKGDGVISFTDAKQNKDDKQTIARSWYEEIKSALKKLYWTGALNKTELFAQMRETLTESERKTLVEEIKDVRTVLGVALMELEE